MANLEVAELKKARHNTHQFSYLYTRQPIEYKPPSSPLETEEDLGKDIIQKNVSIEYTRFETIKVYQCKEKPAGNPNIIYFYPYLANKQPYSELHRQKLDGRIERARERAMRKKYKNQYDDYGGNDPNTAARSENIPTA